MGSGFGLARGPLLNAFLFQVFNTSSFYLIMGLPMMLYFKKLGASATGWGVVAALGASIALLFNISSPPFPPSMMITVIIITIQIGR